MSTPIQSLKIAIRTTNCLLAEGITTVEQVAKFIRKHGRTGLLRIPNLGGRAADELMAVIGEHQPSERPAATTKNHESPVVLPVDLRDYFAAKAMQGLLAQSCGTALGSDPIHGAQYAYQMADAMLAARKPEYDPARMASQALDDRATIAGLESAVSHLSALFDEFRALLVEVNDVCGRDGHGGP